MKKHLAPNQKCAGRKYIKNNLNTQSWVNSSTYLKTALSNKVFSYNRDKLLKDEVNNFVSVDFQTQVCIWFLIHMKFSTRITSKKEGIRKCNSAGKCTYILLVDDHVSCSYTIS